jgi:hypothetical protein
MTFSNGSHGSSDSSPAVDELEEDWNYHDGDFPLNLMDEPENITDIGRLTPPFSKDPRIFCSQHSVS